MKLSIFFEPRDLWIGVYWDKSGRTEYDYDTHIWTSYAILSIYICLVPIFPILLRFERKRWTSLFRITVDYSEWRGIEGKS